MNCPSTFTNECNHVVIILCRISCFCFKAYRQQLRCDVVGEPGQTLTPCSRCKKHNLQCKIDANFKRVKKRGLAIPEISSPSSVEAHTRTHRKYEELQREVEELRAKLAERRQEEASKVQHPYGIQNEVSISKSGLSLPSMQRLEDISLSGQRIAHLYNE